FRSIRDGYASVALAGGSDAPLSPICFEGYGAMGALSKGQGPEASRPFDTDRDGFVLSEGACVLVLEEFRHAQDRGAVIYGEIAGYAGGADAFHQTRPSAEGEATAMKRALLNACIDASALGFISTHATATRIGDRIEAEAIRSAFGNDASRIPVAAFKSSTGHMLAASGAFEAAVSLMVLRNQIIPPTLNLDSKDRECDLNVVTRVWEITADYAIVNSFGFGGVNAVLVIRRGGDR
ncbi:MAG: beta-ketoacyl-[acyl-carrier-protein] synthase family protein, partial [bacterium]